MPDHFLGEGPDSMRRISLRNFMLLTALLSLGCAEQPKDTSPWRIMTVYGVLGGSGYMDPDLMVDDYVLKVARKVCTIVIPSNVIYDLEKMGGFDYYKALQKDEGSCYVIFYNDPDIALSHFPSGLRGHFKDKWKKAAYAKSRKYAYSPLKESVEITCSDQWKDDHGGEC